jgi:hypothetical protein
MNKKTFLIPVVFLSLFIFFAPISETNAALTFIRSNDATTTPTIDGNFTVAEWQDAKHYSFYHDDPLSGHPQGNVHLYVKHTNETLYLLIDDIPDNTSEQDDVLYIYFDCNYDGVRDDNITLELRRNHSLVAQGLGNSLSNWSMGFGSSPNNISDHSVLEIAINITLDSQYDGSSKPEDINYKLPVGTDNNSIRISFQAGERFCNWDIPQNVDHNNPITYAELTFAPPSSFFPFWLLISPDSEAIPFANIEILLIMTISVASIFIYLSKQIRD